MHDFLLAKQIIDEVKKVIAEKRIKKVKTVSLEIGSISMSHDGHPEHLEEINPENLRFGLESLTRNDNLEGVKFEIRKVPGDDWKIADLEV